MVAAAPVMTANAAMTGGAFGRPLKGCMFTYLSYTEALKGLRDFHYDASQFTADEVLMSGEDMLRSFSAMDQLLPQWNQLTLSEKESLATLYVLYSRDEGTGVDIGLLRKYAVESGVNIAEMDALVAKIYSQLPSASAPAQTQAPATSWKQDTKGWWVERADGSYLVSEWYQSPASGLWYYMGSDGYMLTNTTTPDGYQVNADGVWVQ